MNFLVGLFLVQWKVALSNENHGQIDGQHHELSLQDQTKLNWLACYLLSYNFLESETDEIEQISKELCIPFRPTGLKLATEFIQSCKNTLSVAESKMILLDSENTSLLYRLKTKIYIIRKENIKKYGISLTEDQKNIVKEIKKTSEEFKSMIQDFSQNINQLQLPQIQNSDHNTNQDDWNLFFNILSVLGIFGMIISGFFMLLGFGVAGVTAGSFAALWQSFIGNVAAGSVFSILTALGMKGCYWKIFMASFASASAYFSKWF